MVEAVSQVHHLQSSQAVPGLCHGAVCFATEYMPWLICLNRLPPSTMHILRQVGSSTP
jgi:hypothetical protein